MTARLAGIAVSAHSLSVGPGVQDGSSMRSNRLARVAESPS